MKPAFTLFLSHERFCRRDPNIMTSRQVALQAAWDAPPPSPSRRLPYICFSPGTRSKVPDPDSLWMSGGSRVDRVHVVLVLTGSAAQQKFPERGSASDDEGGTTRDGTISRLSIDVVVRFHRVAQHQADPIFTSWENSVFPEISTSVEPPKPLQVASTCGAKRRLDCGRESHRES